MLRKSLRLVKRLYLNTGGNALMLVGLGLPAMIGSAGMAVDTAQWYMWKRELQYAADQAAIAGAWAKAKNATGSTFVERARTEFEANQAVVDFAEEPEVSLANYAGGTDNSVVVRVSATRALPFSSFITGSAATVSVSSQATFAPGQNYTSCMIAVDEDESGAITIGGNASLTAGCGMAALSNSESAVIINGNPQVDAGWVLSAGGIDDWFDEHTDDEILENQTGLLDPFAELLPPDNATPRTYACSNAGTSTVADIQSSSQITYSYKRGANQNSAVDYAHPNPTPPESTSSFQSAVTVPNETEPGTSSGTSVNWIKLSGSGQDTIWRVKTTVTTTTYSNIVATTTTGGAHMQPGTYTSFVTSCDTTMASGIYVIDGGNFEVNAQDIVTGNGIMLVLKNGAGIRVNGGAAINLTAMTASQLITAGTSAADANELAGMLVFEDPDSPGNDGNLINGNASSVLNGTIYLPSSNLTFAGTARVTNQCLMIAAATITIQGSANMSTFCPSGIDTSPVVATTGNAVRLVS